MTVIRLTSGWSSPFEAHLFFEVHDCATATLWMAEKRSFGSFLGRLQVFSGHKTLSKFLTKHFKEKLDSQGCLGDTDWQDCVE
jgi:hypothetical protein